MSKNFFKGILCKVNNKVMIGALDFLRACQKLSPKDYSRQIPKNQRSFAAHRKKIAEKKGFIEDQNQYTDMTFGKKTVQFSGCEIIAVYNALTYINPSRRPSFPSLISHFEKNGMILSGFFGTSPKALFKYFIANDYPAVFSTREADFDSIGTNNDTCILTFYNDASDITKEIHTVCITKENDRFTAHNVYCNGMVIGPFSSITETIKSINNGLAKGISLIGVSQKRSAPQKI